MKKSYKALKSITMTGFVDARLGPLVCRLFMVVPDRREVCWKFSKKKMLFKNSKILNLSEDTVFISEETFTKTAVPFDLKFLTRPS